MQYEVKHVSAWSKYESDVLYMTDILHSGSFGDTYYILHQSLISVSGAASAAKDFICGCSASICYIFFYRKGVAAIHILEILSL